MTLASLRGRHEGARAFVAGNAPSLARLDLTRLAGEVLFTVNRGYLARPFGLPRAPYHVVSDPLTYEPYAAEMRAADVGLRLYRSDVCDLPVYAAAPEREPAVRFPFHRTPTMDEGHFSTDATLGTYRGFTAVLDAVQLAVFMGCRDIYVIGCDLDYDPSRTHVYGTGPVEQARRDVMPVPRVLAAMVVAERVIRGRGGRFANAGVGGRLDVIPRIDFETLF